MIHDLKTWPEPFNLVLGGIKTFELRVDDRGFAVGDLLRLCEYEPFSRAYTGRELTRRVSCILRRAGPVALPDGLVVLGLEDPAPLDEQARLVALLGQLAGLLGVKPAFGAIEEQPLLDAARALATMRDLQDASIGMLEALGEGRI